MANFPTLKPAFTALFEIDPAASIGELSTGGTLHYIKIVGGTFKSDPTFETKLDATVVSGGDWAVAVPSGKHLVLDVRGIAKTDDNAIISFDYKGLILLDAAIGLILSGSPSAKTTAFGNTFTHKFFKTGAAKYKSLEENLFVASGRFIVETDRKVFVEYKVSQVVAS